MISEELGQGAFGKVYKGTMKTPSSKKKSLKTTTAVAVKLLQGKLQRVLEWMLTMPCIPDGRRPFNGDNLWVLLFRIVF